MAILPGTGKGYSMATLREVRDEIASILDDERDDDGTYEVRSSLAVVLVEIRLVDLLEWRDTITAALGEKV